MDFAFFIGSQFFEYSECIVHTNMQSFYLKNRPFAILFFTSNLDFIGFISNAVRLKKWAYTTYFIVHLFPHLCMRKQSKKCESQTVGI